MAHRQTKNNGQARHIKPRQKRDMLQFAFKLDEDMRRLFLKEGDAAPPAQLRNDRLAKLTQKERNEYFN